MYCKNCGAQIEDGANFCPACGANQGQPIQYVEQQPVYQQPVYQYPVEPQPVYTQPPANNPPKKNKKRYPVIGIIALVLGVFIFVGAIIGGNEGPQKVDPSGSSTIPNASQPDVFGVGDTLEMGNIFVTLNDVYEVDGTSFLTPSEGNVFVICEFTIENKSNSEITVSTMMSFECYFDDYAANLSISAMAAADGKSQLDGSVAAGKKINGIVGYEAPAGWKEMEVRFSPNAFSSKAFVFNHIRTSESNIIFQNEQFSATFQGVQDQPELSVFYLMLKIENKTETEVIVNLESADVDGETIPLIATGVPLQIRPGNSGSTGFIFSMVNLSIDTVLDAKKASFKIVLRDAATFSIISESDIVTIELNK